MEPLAVSVSEAARLIGVSRTRLYQLIRDGRLRKIKSGGRTLLLVQDLRDYLGSLAESC